MIVRVTVWLAFWLGLAIFPDWFFVRHRAAVFVVVLAFLSVEVIAYVRGRHLHEQG